MRCSDDEFIYQSIRAHQMNALLDVHVAIVGECNRLTERQIYLRQ